MAIPRTLGWPVAALGLAAALLATAAPACAAGPEQAAPSLAQVPADAAFYSASLRLREQWDRFSKSNAFARLKALPAVQTALKQAQAEMEKPGNPLGQFMALARDPANRQLLELLADMVSEECFTYGAANWGDFTELMLQVMGAARYGPAMMQLAGEGGGDPSTGQVRAMLRVLNEHAARLQAPDTVIGFRLKDSRAATEQLGRLEEVLKDVLGRQPQLKDRLKRRQFAGGDFLVLELDGSLVPWDEVPWEKIETKEGEFAALQKKLKGLKLTISLGVKDRYLLLAIGAGTEGVTKLGQGAALAGRAELRPLAKYADRTVTAVAYSSAKMLSAFSTRPEDIDGMVEMADAALKQAPIADEQRAKLLKDLKALAQEWKSALPKPAAAMAFSLLTDRGQESFSYSYLAGAQAPDKPLTILDHLGGSPLLAAAGRTGDATPAYKGLVKWAKVFYGHFEEIVLPQLGEAEKEQFQAVTKVVFPLLKRFDEITGQQFLPSLADGQSALVIDARWTSRRWHTALPEAKKPLPMLELGCVHSVSDAELLTKALANYRQLINDSLDAARQLGARIPEEVTIPKAQAKKVAGGTLYWWPLPEAGQDPQVLPNLGIGERVMVVTLSEAHSQRLLKATPLQVDGGPLAQQRPLLGAAVVDFAGLVQAARPWVEDVALPEVLREVPEEGPPGLTRKEVPEQVRTVLEVLQCLRGMTSATYVEDGAVVTHSETVFRDLPAK